MTTKTWTGSTGLFTDNTWSPDNAPPQPGDTANITVGTVIATSRNLDSLIINVTSNATTNGTFALASSSLSASTTLTLGNPNAYGAGGVPLLVIRDVATNNGAINITGSNSTVALQSSAASGSGTLVNNGTILLNDSSPLFSAANGYATALLTNNGSISVTNPDNLYQSPTFGLTINGTGMISVGTNGKVDFAGSVGNGQTLTFAGGVNAQSVVQVDAPAAFNATISQFVSGDRITVTNTPYTNFTYTSTGAQSGVLTLYNNGAATSALTFAGNYTADKFALAYNQLDATHSTLAITTAVTNAATGATDLPNAVFRFFDTRFGTHFFTSDVGEKNAVVANRPDLKEETNGFGDVSQNDKSAVAVYRFFDKNFGTHFFTANAGERDSVIANRPDLTYEASSTFYEHSSAQAGDVAVYRLFDKTTGTQFLTGDQGEYKGITTPGSATYRADLSSEGVAFYAPQGSYT